MYSAYERRALGHGVATTRGRSLLAWAGPSKRYASAVRAASGGDYGLVLEAAVKGGATLRSQQEVHRCLACKH